MKMIEMKDIDETTVFINPEHIRYVRDVSSYSMAKSAIVQDTGTIYVPYHAQYVYDEIRKETNPGYCSYDTMRKLIEYEKQYKNQCSDCSCTNH